MLAKLFVDYDVKIIEELGPVVERFYLLNLLLVNCARLTNQIFKVFQLFLFAFFGYNITVRLEASGVLVELLFHVINLWFDVACV